MTHFYYHHFKPISAFIFAIFDLENNSPPRAQAGGRQITPLLWMVQGLLMTEESCPICGSGMARVWRLESVLKEICPWITYVCLH